jgi:hypothetical protein
METTTTPRSSLPPDVIIVICVVVILVIVAIVLIVWALVSAADERARNNATGTGAAGGASEPCSQFVDLDTLPQVPDSDICIQQGQPTSLYYMPSNNFVVAPWGTSAFDVCIGYCSGFTGSTGSTGGVCTGPNYNNMTAQENFDACLQQLSTTVCFPPTPIAARGTTLYYAFSPTCGVCDGCTTS